MSNTATPPPQKVRRRYPAIALQLTVIAAVGVAAYLVAQRLFQTSSSLQQPKQRKHDSVLAIPDGELDLGRVWEAKRHEHLVHITNLLDRPVTIAGFAKSCSCLEITPAKRVSLQGHESRQFTLQLALPSDVGLPAQPDERPFEIAFTARYSTDGRTDGAAERVLKEAVLPTLQFRPAQLQIGTRSERQLDPEPPLHIAASDRIAAIRCESPPGWSVALSRDDGSPRTQITATAQRKAGGKRGPISEVVRFTPVDQAGRALPPKELRITGEVVPDVLGHPREFHHGRQPCGMVADETIHLVSLTNRPFRVTRVTSTGDDLQVATIRQDDGNALYSLRIRFTAAGEQQVDAIFGIQEEGVEEFEVTVPVRYHGLQEP